MKKVIDYGFVIALSFYPIAVIIDGPMNVLFTVYHGTSNFNMDYQYLASSIVSLLIGFKLASKFHNWRRNKSA